MSTGNLGDCLISGKCLRAFSADAPPTMRIDEVFTDTEVNQWAFITDDLLTERSVLKRTPSRYFGDRTRISISDANFVAVAGPIRPPSTILCLASVTLDLVVGNLRPSTQDTLVKAVPSLEWLGYEDLRSR
jgi:hypothetical protein